MTPLEAMRSALDALGAMYQYYREAEALYDHNWPDSRSVDYHNAIVNLRAAIEQMEKAEPIGIGFESADGKYVSVLWFGREPKPGEYVYLHPQGEKE